MLPKNLKYIKVFPSVHNVLLLQSKAMPETRNLLLYVTVYLCLLLGGQAESRKVLGLEKITLPFTYLKGSLLTQADFWILFQVGSHWCQTKASSLYLQATQKAATSLFCDNIVSKPIKFLKVLKCTFKS